MKPETCDSCCEPAATDRCERCGLRACADCELLERQDDSTFLCDACDLRPCEEPGCEALTNTTLCHRHRERLWAEARRWAGSF